MEASGSRPTTQRSSPNRTKGTVSFRSGKCSAGYSSIYFLAGLTIELFTGTGVAGGTPAVRYSQRTKPNPRPTPTAVAEYRSGLIQCTGSATGTGRGCGSGAVFFSSRTGAAPANAAAAGRPFGSG